MVLLNKTNPAGVGGAEGGREKLYIHIYVCPYIFSLTHTHMPVFLVKKGKSVFKAFSKPLNTLKAR